MVFLSIFVVFSVAGICAAKAQNIERYCKEVSMHTPDADVNFKGDSDVPATLNPLPSNLGGVHIPITLDIASRYGLELPDGIELKPDVSMMSIYPDGRIEYNGEVLEQNAQYICGRAMKDDGLKAKDSLTSPAKRYKVKDGIEGEILEGQYTQ